MSSKQIEAIEISIWKKYRESISLRGECKVSFPDPVVQSKVFFGLFFSYGRREICVAQIGTRRGSESAVKT